MKRRGTTTYGAVVTDSLEDSKANDNAFCWREPCSRATGTGAGRADWQTNTHPTRWPDKARWETTQIGQIFNSVRESSRGGRPTPEEADLTGRCCLDHQDAERILTKTNSAAAWLLLSDPRACAIPRGRNLPNGARLVLSRPCSGRTSQDCVCPAGSP